MGFFDLFAAILEESHIALQAAEVVPQHFLAVEDGGVEGEVHGADFIAVAVVRGADPDRGKEVAAHSVAEQVEGAAGGFEVGVGVLQGLAFVGQLHSAVGLDGGEGEGAAYLVADAADQFAVVVELQGGVHFYGVVVEGFEFGFARDIDSGDDAALGGGPEGNGQGKVLLDHFDVRSGWYHYVTPLNCGRFPARCAGCSVDYSRLLAGGAGYSRLCRQLFISPVPD